MSKITVGYLTYVTDSNRSYRLDDFKLSLASMETLRGRGYELVSVDNNSISEVRSACEASGVFDACYHYDSNFFDVALFYTTLWHAVNSRCEYVVFLYDDFIVFNASRLEDAVAFMDEHREVACTRITKYSYVEQHKFNSHMTPKSTNPDSVNHSNNVTGQALTWQGPFNYGQTDFYTNNWHYSSRPSMWRVSELEKLLPKFVNVLAEDVQVPILQGLEGLLMRNYEDAKLVTGVMDVGVAHTTEVGKSVRTKELTLNKEMGTRTSLKDLGMSYAVKRSNTK